DQGILISDDMVAIEQASVDILRKARFIPDSMAGDRKVKEGEDVLRKLHGKEYRLQIDEAKRLGLGSKRYTLISV
ncbi:MAG: 4Fe-4S ferredoxin, partial [Nitrospirota bacterium]